MTNTPEKFLAAARSYKGTPFHHQGRQPGLALDCIGVAVCAARECGLEMKHDIGYPVLAFKDRITSPLSEYATEIELEDVRPGDLGIFRTPQSGKTPHHVAVFCEDGGASIVHACSPSIGKVIEEPLGVWKKLLVSCWRVNWGEEAAS